MPGQHQAGRVRRAADSGSRHQAARELPVAHSSTSLFKLTPRARAKALSRRCFVARKRMVNDDMALRARRSSQLQPRSRRMYDEPRKTQFSTAEIPPIKRQNRRITRGNSQLQLVVVALVPGTRRVASLAAREPPVFAVHFFSFSAARWTFSILISLLALRMASSIVSARNCTNALGGLPFSKHVVCGE